MFAPVPDLPTLPVSSSAMQLARTLAVLNRTLCLAHAPVQRRGLLRRKHLGGALQLLAGDDQPAPRRHGGGQLGPHLRLLERFDRVQQGLNDAPGERYADETPGKNELDAVTASARLLIASHHWLPKTGAASTSASASTARMW